MHVVNLLPVDEIWKLASDGKWHTLNEIARRAEVPTEMAGLAVDFLDKYGFAETSAIDVRWFRIRLGAPSPLEIAESLSGLL
jgi:hypothetical protein